MPTPTDPYDEDTPLGTFVVIGDSDGCQDPDCDGTCRNGGLD